MPQNASSADDGKRQHGALHPPERLSRLSLLADAPVVGSNTLVVRHGQNYRAVLMQGRFAFRAVREPPLHEAEDLKRARDGFRTAFYFEFLVDVLQVLLDRSRADVQESGDLVVGLAARDPDKQLGLPAREPERLEGLFREGQRLLLQQQQV